MTATRCCHFAAVAAAATTLAAPGASQATPRPHSRVVTYDRGIVRVERLQIAVRPAARALNATVFLTVSNEHSAPTSRDLVVGSCVRGSPAYPTCPAAGRSHMVLAAHERRVVRLSARLPAPAARLDAVEAALVTPGQRTRFFVLHSDAELLVTGHAWRGSGAGERYGVVFAPGDAARRLNFDIPLFDVDSAYIDVRWTGTAAPEAAATTIARCSAKACSPETLERSTSRSGANLFGRRFGFKRVHADSLKLEAATPAGEQLFSASLPWPSWP